MKVSIERYVQQVHDGSHYKGHVKIAQTKLDYELRFAVPIPQLDVMELPEDKDKIRRIFQLTVKKGDASIELTDEEYGFFFQMLVPFAAEFYKNPQTRDSNEGIMGMTLRGQGPMAALGVTSSISITSSGSPDFPPELCEMLNAPKFGCALAA